ncbi:transposase [uncultured Draconibacterium sp.]|uniref:transposase n=1 Tax=uncultured Draconibacterium sp. TaxID=1573823 RepID=UPI002AA6D0A2|nr:transposase [uncultured Draconibacterium sp.]
MPDKFRNKYRISSTRLQNWDYGSNAAYFVTICTQGREHYFGDIVNGEMQLSPIGKLAEKYWMEIPQHFPFVQLNAFVVMPNHVHGIIVIDRNDDINRDAVQTPKLGVSTWKSGTLGVIINQYKRAVTINARKINPHFAWQSRYHDHIIRNDESFERICNYILSNPENWYEDRHKTD